MRERLGALDRRLLGNGYRNGWLLVVALVGLILCVLTIIGLIYGSHNRVYGPILAGPVLLLVLPLAEIWRRRQLARGRLPFTRFQALDDRLGSSRIGRHLPGLRPPARH